MKKMLQCEQCGCQEELAVGIVWENEEAQVVCLACHSMYPLPEEEYYANTVAIEVAKQRMRESQPMIVGEIEDMKEEDLPF